MELKEFIKGVLKDVTAAIDESSDGKYTFGVWGKERGECIQFDIAVSVNEATASGKTAGGGITVVNLFVGAKGEKKESLTSENVHKIRFDVYVHEKSKQVEEE